MSDVSNSCSYINHSIFSLSGNGMDLANCDGSIQVLKTIFGQPIDVLTSGSATADGTSVHSLITLFIGHFNAAMITLVMIIYGYMVVVGVINSANEGKFGGRVMGHWWYPIRAIVPASMLFPIKGGFCLLQFLLMYTVLVGVNIANQVWHESVQDINLGYTPVTPQALNTAVAKDIGLIFVYGAVNQILENNADLHNVTIGSSGKAPVLSSPYQTQLKEALLNACNDTREGIQSPATCEQAVNTLFGYNLSATLSPAAPGPLSGAAYSDTSNRYYQYAVGFGSAPNTFDGNYIADAQYTLNFDHLIQDSDGSGVLSTSNIVDMLTGTRYEKGCDHKSGLLGTCQHTKTVTGDNIFDNIVTAKGQPADKACLGENCSFSGVIDDVMDLLIQNPTEQYVNQLQVQGTGQTCSATCRDPVTHMPYTKYGNAQSCKKAGFQMETQCYQMVPAANGQPAQARAIPPQYVDNSWWYGSRVYLQLNDEMTRNIKQMAKDIQAFQINPDDISKIATIKPNEGGIKGLGTYVTLLQREYNFNGTDQIGTGKSLLPSGQVVFTPATEASSSFALPDWNGVLLCSISPSLPHKIIGKDGNGDDITLNQHNCIKYYQDHQKLNGTYSIESGADAPALSVDFNANFDQDFYNEMAALPQEYRMPIGILIELFYYNKISYEQLKGYVNNIITVLKANHVYPGSQMAPDTENGVDSSQLSNPVGYWVGSMFNRMLGVNVPGIGGDSSTGGLFQDIYSLGNTPLDSVNEVITNSLNTIAQAQRIGLEMISTVTLSLEDVYQHFRDKLAGFRKKDATVAASFGAGALGTGMGLTMFGSAFANSISSAVAIAGQTTLQFMLADQMYEIGQDLMWLPLLFVVLTALFTAGVSFALLLPLVPFILFWAGQISWLLGVIEAMIAVPLLVLGWMTPGGHEHWGHMLPGIKMWFALIFRPVLMVLGLLIGLVLTYIVIRFSSQGFQLIGTQIVSYAGSIDNYGTFSVSQQLYAKNVSMTQGIVACIMLTTFCAFMVLAFNKCFSCIYAVPEKVMQWIGGMADKAGEQDLQQMTSSVSQTAQQGAQAGGQSMEKGVGADSQYTQQTGQSDSSALGQGVQIAHQVTRESQGANMQPKPQDKE